MGSFLAVVATIFWGFENNFTQVLSQRNPIQVTMIKGLGVGIGSLILAVLFNEKLPNIKVIILALILGFFAYGISIVFYILAQRYIGAAKTSAYYAVAPFLSVLLSVLFLHEKMTSLFIFSLILMIIGSILLTKDALK
ncbi:DMT family transporter [Lactobacillus sp. PV034]|uniref:DMT family transporter n=1 Tax=Lactobacillus sp. PV034 TaxID=2594495 RepID=UPI00223EB5AF|nr:DMT family transporter [Lactobacillus sp. PV034]